MKFIELFLFNLNSQYDTALSVDTPQRIVHFHPIFLSFDLSESSARAPWKSFGFNCTALILVESSKAVISVC